MMCRVDMVGEEGDFKADSLQSEGAMPLSKTGNAGKTEARRGGFQYVY